MWVDDQGIRTKLLDQEILFEFANPPDKKSINTLRDQVIQTKENHKQEINLIVGEVCSNIPKAFWHKKQHEVELLYKPNFSEKNIPTKARPIQMNKDLLSYSERRSKIFWIRS